MRHKVNAAIYLLYLNRNRKHSSAGFSVSVVSKQLLKNDILPF